MKENKKNKRTEYKIRLPLIFLLILSFLFIISNQAYAGESQLSLTSQLISDKDIIIQTTDLTMESIKIDSELFSINLEIGNYLINHIGSNTSIIKQVGDSHVGLQNQVGIGNLAYIYQESYNNSLTQNQYGNNNTAYGIQKGVGNVAIQNQYSNGNTAIIIQYGLNNYAEQYQGASGRGGNRSIVIQNGVGNYVRVIQN